MEPLRCHLLIGSPSCGKSTTAAALAPLLQGAEGQPAVVLATDAIRAELFGDAAVQGPPQLIQQHLRERIVGAVAAGMPVVVDATHARRPWRLEITQALALPRAVEWIGWWHFTPLTTCLRWNRKRQRQVPPPVIRQMHAFLADEVHGPCRAEGFAAIVAVQPTHHGDLVEYLRGALRQLGRRISAACNRQRHLCLHGHSRLLDLERLLLLIRLLAHHPDLASGDQGSREQLELIVSPLPGGDLPERAGALLRSLHGPCYGSVVAVRRDLAWLDAQGFFCATPITTPIEPLPPPLPPPNGVPAAGGVHGGVPALGDAPVFQRVMTLLRHLLQQLQAIPGGYGSGERATLRKDIENVLTPYGFRLHRHYPRHGYCLGTALLSAPRLVEIHGVVQIAARRLADPSAVDLLEELEQRLQWGGIAVEGTAPLRCYLDGTRLRADRRLAGTLAEPQQAERIQTAILEHRRVRLELLPTDRRGSDGEPLRVWPLQLVHADGFWFLACEEDAIGHAHGLLRCERLDRLVLTAVEARSRRTEAEHREAIGRLQRLLLLCGGVELGGERQAQEAILQPGHSVGPGLLVTLRFSCTREAFAAIRDAPTPLAAEQIRLSLPLPGDGWGTERTPPWLLEPNGAGSSHPYPVELDLPGWIVTRGIALRSWLRGFGSGIRLEAPQALVQEQQGQALEVLAAMGQGARTH